MQAYKEKELLSTLKAADQKQHRRYLFRKVLFMGIALGGTVALIDENVFLGDNVYPENIFSIDFIVPVLLVCGVSWLFWFWSVITVKRTREKTKIALEIVDTLRDEWFPQMKIKMAMDVTPYKSSDKCIWKGRSMYGNAKYKYLDPWFTLKMLFADRSVVSFRYRNKIKTKKGSVVKNKRQLQIYFCPNLKRYQMNQVLNDLPALETNIRRCFIGEYSYSNLVCQCRPLSDDSGFSLKLSQSSQNYGKQELSLIFVEIYSLLQVCMNPVR